MTVLVTRPAQESESLRQILEAEGWSVFVEPILDIVFDEGAAVDLDHVQALLFTSANGVRAFAGVSEVRALPVFCVGKVTAKAARAAGFVIVSVSGGDVDLLAKDVAAVLRPSNGRLVHVAGSHVAGDLAGFLEKRGFEVARAVLYEAQTRQAFSDALLQHIEEGDIDQVLFYSWRSANGFVELAAQSEVMTAGLRAYCLSKNVAKALENCELSEIHVAERPEQDLLLKLLQETSH